LAQAAKPASGFHALLERHKPAILATQCIVINRTPWIVLSFGATSNADDANANS
jgi:hypothetical protein